MYRTTLAQQSDCMPYMIASNKMLIDVAKLKPKNVTELKNGKKIINYSFLNVDFYLNSPINLLFAIVEGFTEAKIDRFGQAIVNKVIEVCNKNPVESKSESENQCGTK